ncbi:hypothetical protein [Roseovarius sp. EL26]|uniref:hypothetical protein n=1 Tax=Roseovarius sp. EL26 TaxID=2126672 RepID=UPI000EA37D38|nr:hypothetical protein [Roseovarius sp. EL26]
MTTLKSLSIAATGLSTLALSSAPALAAASDVDTALTEKHLSLTDQALHTGCEQPANRDYHTVLSAFNDESAAEYKFSGCGSAI